MLNLFARYFLILALALGFSQSSIAACLSTMDDTLPVSQSGMEMPGCHSQVDIDDNPDRNWDECCQENCHSGTSTMIPALFLAQAKLISLDRGPAMITGLAQNHPRIPTPPPNA